MGQYRILVINPGSTSTKIALFEGESPVFVETLRHTVEELAPYPEIIDQYDFRKKVILDVLRQKGIDLATLSAVTGRGGILKPIESGVYAVNDIMVNELRESRYGKHASNLGALIAREIANEVGVPSFIADPVVVDELGDLARVTGVPGVERLCRFHALNHKAMARQAAAKLGGKYEEMNLIVVHLGGGISVGAHCRGRVIDVNNALDGDGPFSPERAGGLPTGGFRQMIYRLGDEKKIYHQLVGGGGLVAYLGTNDAREVERRAEAGDEQARFYYEAMAYQVSKEIGAMAAVMKGDVQGIVLTGGIAHSKMLVSWIRERVEFIAPIVLLPGEFEVEPLAWGTLRVLSGEEQPKVYA